tara:strand:- start:18 stop:230 length:213 start_codon:yes stop_codon:yes gene_type:complete
MNERILELADKAIEDMPGAWNIPDEFCEKFAELIVKECADLAESFHRHQYDMTGNLELHEFIREHFGVEE